MYGDMWLMCMAFSWFMFCAVLFEGLFQGWCMNALGVFIGVLYLSMCGSGLCSIASDLYPVWFIYGFVG